MSKPKLKKRPKPAPKRRAKPTRARAGKATKAPRKARPAQKKTPARTVKSSSGRRPTSRKQPATQKVRAKPQRVKPRAAKPPAKRRIPPARPARPIAPSTHPEAIRSRARRAEAKGIAEALEAARLEKIELAAARRRKKKIPPTDRELAPGWLETIRQHCAHVADTSLEATTAEVGSIREWMAVGRFDFLDQISYLDIGEMLERIAADDFLSARIDPTRVSQIRIIFLDPDARPGKGGGSYVSAIGAWDFIVGDLIGEILGGGEGDELSLAARYDQSKIPSMYVYFSTDTRTYTTAPGFLKTQTVKLG
jgi:hypothetical protein